MKDFKCLNFVCCEVGPMEKRQKKFAREKVNYWLFIYCYCKITSRTANF